MKYTFKEFKSQYPDDDACLDAILQRQLAVDSSCHGCGVAPAKFYRITGRRGYACQDCGHHVFPCVGTVFQHSSTPLTLWFHAMYLMTSTRNGVAAKELQRQLGVTYKCAWRIGHQLRDLMAARDKATTPPQLSGHVEIDETLIGGKQRRMGRGAMMDNKTVVMGLLQRDGAVKGRVVKSGKKKYLLPVLKECVTTDAQINSDNYSAYRKIGKLGFTKHETLNHSEYEWARGIHHTNTIEGFWSHLKRGISSTHVSISKKHAQRYVNEFAFRYNNRKEPEEMFARMLAQISKSNV